MKNKVMTLSEAVELVKDGSILGIGGMTIYRRPFAFCRELAKKGVKDLTLFGITLGIESDLLIGCGCVDRVRTSYLGLEYFGLAPNFRKWSENGNLEVIEETEATIVYAIRAAMAHVDFYPASILFGTDILKVRKDIKQVRSPYSDRLYVAVPCVRPDVSVIHVQMADEFGNACINGQLCIDKELAISSEKTILTAEKIVETSQIAREKAKILTINVNAVVKLPYGAHPTSCYPYYRPDIDHIIEYLRLAKSDFLEYTKKYVYEPRTHEEYLERIGIAKKTTELSF